MEPAVKVLKNSRKCFSCREKNFGSEYSLRYMVTHLPASPIRKTCYLFFS